MRTITVNGVPLNAVLKLKRQEGKTRTPPTKRKYQKKTNINQSTTPSVQGNKKIWEYMSKKKARTELVQPEQPENPGSTTGCNEDNRPEDNLEEVRNQNLPELPVVKTNENITKKTFNTFNRIQMTRKTSVSDRIQRFQELSDGDECVIGSGRCATHNVRVTRNVMKVRKSVQNEAGELMWRLCESTVLVCPSAHHRKPLSSDVVMSSNSDRGTPMGTQRFLERSTNQNTEPDEFK